MKKSDEELTFYLKFELAPYPLSLFDDVGMRKTAKASLYPLFQSIDIVFDKNNAHYIVDGGMLLYRVKWPSGCTFQRVFSRIHFISKKKFCQSYKSYLQ